MSQVSDKGTFTGEGSVQGARKSQLRGAKLACVCSPWSLSPTASPATSARSVSPPALPSPSQREVLPIGKVGRSGEPPSATRLLRRATGRARGPVLLSTDNGAKVVTKCRRPNTPSSVHIHPNALKPPPSVQSSPGETALIFLRPDKPRRQLRRRPNIYFGGRHQPVLARRFAQTLRGGRAVKFTVGWSSRKPTGWRRAFALIASYGAVLSSAPACASCSESSAGTQDTSLDSRQVADVRSEDAVAAPTAEPGWRFMTEVAPNCYGTEIAPDPIAAAPEYKWVSCATLNPRCSRLATAGFRQDPGPRIFGDANPSQNGSFLTLLC